jgi:hypothetical protein
MQRLATLKDTEMIIGYNDKYPSNMLPPNMCTLVQNAFLDSNKIIERTGYAIYGNDTGENKPNLGFHAHTTATHNQLLKINDNVGGTSAVMYYKTSSGNWTLAPGSNSFTAGLTCVLVTASGNTYITNGTDVVHKWDGVTLTTVASIPIGRYLINFHGFLWSLNVSGARSRAFYSNFQAPELWTAGQFLDVSPDDGDVITGVGIIKDELVVSKQFRVYSFQGWTELAFTVATLNEQLATYGCIANETFVNIGNDLLFLSYTGDIPHIRSIQKTRFADTVYGGVLSNDIEGTMNGLSKSQLSKSSQVFDGRKVWFFLPVGASTYNDLCLVYDTITTGWSKHTGIYSARGIISTISGKAEVYFADSRNAKVYVMNGGNSDNGTAIDFQYISRQFTPDFKRFYKFKYLFTQYAAGNTGLLNLYTSVDDNPFDLVEVIDLDNQGSTFPMTFTFPFGSGTVTMQNRTELPYGVFQMCSVKFSKNDTNPRATIYQYELMGFPRNIRDLPSG